MPDQVRHDEKVEGSDLIRIRRVAILFALGSAIYWEGMVALIGLINPLAGLDVAPYWLVVLMNVGPACIYAIVTLIFCHWLARRVLRQAQERSEQE
ncbi:hypothetical protein [Sphingobium sp. CAP-1]|uniref:hypothetical protein n=1 Tax=Sphingobium sp. CAP-1 TaxID=2676077 RepID=UPI0012BB1DCB|nr:hypothetical protein [Sphingobium sp. CAP-1]QGP78383.1 hypothetical protein GL174_04810 [Sphingobium sp. CAP-1]